MVEDIDSWDYFLSFIVKEADINEKEKQEIIRNWGYLRKVLGEDWFKKDENKYHPLKQYFYNRAPWCIRTVSELGLGIELLSKKENFNDILKRILLPDTFEEAYYEFRVGHSLFKLGISFEFLKPIKKKKTPDIAVSIGGRKIFLEVTKKNSPEDPLNSYQNFQKISWFLWSKGGLADDFVFFFEILKPLSTPRTEKILQICEGMLEKAKTSGFEEHHISDIIDLYLVRKENVERVPKKKRVMQGKTPDVNEVNRIKGTIKEKSSQLGENPSMLMIFDSYIWPSNEKNIFYSNLVDELEEYVNQFTNISAAIIYIEMHSVSEEDSINEGRNYIAISGSDRELLMSKNKVIILNEFAKYPLLLAEIEMLKKL